MSEQKRNNSGGEDAKLMRSVKQGRARAEETAKRVLKKQKQEPKNTLEELKNSGERERSRW